MNSSSWSLSSLLGEINQWRENLVIAGWLLVLPKDYQDKKWLKKIPNAISISRLVAVFPLLLCMASHSQIGPWRVFIFLLLIALTDLIDGPLARLLKCSSDTGASLDPLADKFLFIAVLIASQIHYSIELWLPLVACLVGGEIIYTGLRVTKLKYKIEPYSSSIWGKSKFFAQMIGIHLLLFPLTPITWGLVIDLILTLSGFFLTFNIFQEIIYIKKRFPISAKAKLRPHAGELNK